MVHETAACMKLQEVTVGALNMHRSNSTSKLTIQKVNFPILRQLTQNVTQGHSNVITIN